MDWPCYHLKLVVTTSHPLIISRRAHKILLFLPDSILYIIKTKHLENLTRILLPHHPPKVRLLIKITWTKKWILIGLLILEMKPSQPSRLVPSTESKLLNKVTLEISMNHQLKLFPIKSKEKPHNLWILRDLTSAETIGSMKKRNFDKMVLEPTHKK